MKKLTTVIVSILILFGCSVNVKPVRFKGPNGNVAYSMKCSGSGRTLEKCYIIASKICPEDYEIIHITDRVYGIMATMTIECKGLKY